MSNGIEYKVLDVFENRFHQKPLIVLSPGRINLIGEHTDYNDGFVFPATIDKYITVAISKSDKPYSTVYSMDFDESVEIWLYDLKKQEKGSWKNYIIGVVAGIIEKGKSVGNFNLVFGGNIPIGAGMSSSAALENAVAFGLNELFGLDLDLIEMMNIAIEAEHNYAGVNCGVMDQFSNLYGKKENAILLDCSDLSYNYIQVQLEDHQLLLINTNVKHQLSNSPYNQRKQSCKTGFEIIHKRFPDVSSLSRATIEQLNLVKNELSQETYNRCLYVIEENQRVQFAKDALKSQNWKDFGDLLFASHQGLSELYEVSCSELDFIVDLAKKDPSVLGSRMMGGGFGGCTINLIKKDSVEKFIEKVKMQYQDKFGINPAFYPVSITNGTKIIEL